MQLIVMIGDKVENEALVAAVPEPPDAAVPCVATLTAVVRLKLILRPPPPFQLTLELVTPSTQMPVKAPLGAAVETLVFINGAPFVSVMPDTVKLTFGRLA